MPTIDQLAQNFMTALNNAERTGDVKPLVALFTDEALVGSIALRKPHHGSAGAMQFWTDYLKIFQSVKSEFVHIHASGDLAALEWTSEGILSDGTAINYRGVSILEFEAGKISRFRTYYDSAAFLPEGAKLLGREVEV